MRNQLERNIGLFYLLRGLTLPYFWLPILYSYLTTVKGFGIAETTLLLGLQEFILIFLEIPTGVIADKISRKFSVGLGIAITSLPLALLPFVDSYLGAIIIFSTRAIGKALVSGADSSLLYDTLVDLGRTKEYKEIKTKSAALVMGVTTLCMFSGGWMGQVGWYSLALILPFPLQMLAALGVSRMVEPESSRKAQQIQESNYLKHTKNAIVLVARSKELVLLTLVFAILEGTAVNMKWYYPAIFEHLGFGLGIAGTVMAGLYGVKTLINSVGTKLILKDAYQNTLFWTALIAMLWGSVALALVPAVAVGIIIVILLGIELANNSCEELIHDRLSSNVRATAMSFVNLVSSIGATALLLLWGSVIQHGSLPLSLGAQAGVFAGGAILIWLAGSRAVRPQ